MRFYLGTFIGTGTESNPYRVAADDYAIIDLRPSSTGTAGRCLIAAPAPLTPVPSGWRDLGDVLDGPLSTQIRNRLGTDLSLTLAANTPRGIIAELLILQGRTDGTRWKPLQATREGRNRIVLYNDVVFDAPVVVGATITDDFNRANETPLAGSWTKAHGAGTVNLASNELTSTTSGDSYYRYDAADLATTHHWSEITSVSISNVNDYYGPVVRYSSGAHTLYLGSVRETATATARIIKVVATVVTVIATSNQTAAAAPYTTRLEANGSTITLTSTDTTTVSTTDTAITGALRVGFYGRNFAVSQIGDDFSASDLPLGATLTGSLFTKAPTFFTGVVSRGAVALTGSLFTKSPTFFTGTISATRTLTGSLFTKAPTFFTGTVTPGVVTVTGVLFTKAPTFPTGAVTSTRSLTGSLFVKAPTFFTGTVTSGGVSLTGVLFTQAPTFFTGTITAGAVTLTGTLFQQAPTFPTGTVTTTVTLNGVLYQNTPTFPTGTIGQAGTLFGTLFVKAPTFFTGAITRAGPSFWITNPAGYTANPSPFVRVGGPGPSPWGTQLSGRRFEKAPSFPTGAVT